MAGKSFVPRYATSPPLPVSMSCRALRIVLVGKDPPHPVPSRDGSRPLDGEWPVAVEGVVHVHDPPFGVKADRGAPAHVGNHEGAVAYSLAEALRRLLRRGLLVQGVENRPPGDLGDAGVAGNGIQLVDDHRDRRCRPSRRSPKQLRRRSGPRGSKRGSRTCMAMRSSFIRELTSYTPPASGFRRPPLPTTAERSERGIPDSARPSRTAALRISS